MASAFPAVTGAAQWPTNSPSLTPTGMLVPLPQAIEPAAAASVADNVSDGYRHVAPHFPRLLAAGHQPRLIVVGAQSKHHLFTASVGLYAGLTAGHSASAT